ncbi:MAG TPA: CsbD family protein [Actinomycetota bacterium]|nr:CsbD family protein [Actinomycetota bacterium]
MGDTTDERLQFEGKWDQMRGRVKEAWGALTDDDLDRTEGKWDQVVGTIKEKTGESMDVIERKLRDISST